MARAPPRRTTRARSSRSPTTATSSTTSRAGSSSSTAAAGFPTRATTPAGSSRSARASQQEARQENARQRTIEQELEWVRLNASARRNKPKARLERLRGAAGPGPQRQARPGPDPHPGRSATRRRRGRGRTGCARPTAIALLIDDLSLHAAAGGIVGVIGPNGAGKTTLLRMITGQEQPDAGTLRIGETVELAYVDQSRDALDPDKTVWEEISGGAGPDQARRPHREQPRLRRRLQLQGHPTSRRRSPSCPAASATGSTWPSSCAAAATCCCSTSRPTTSTSTRCARSRRRCSRSPAARSSSRTIAGSSTGSRPTCSRSRAIRRCAGSRATSRRTRASATSSSAPTPTGRKRITYKKLGPGLESADVALKAVLITGCSSGIGHATAVTRPGGLDRVCDRAPTRHADRPRGRRLPDAGARRHRRGRR